MLQEILLGIHSKMAKRVPVVAVGLATVHPHLYQMAVVHPRLVKDLTVVRAE